ncbi:MAG: GAF domain-containing protein [Chitinophagaceae bacterium]
MKTTIVHLGVSHEIDSAFSLQPILDAWEARQGSDQDVARENEDKLPKLVRESDNLPEDYDQRSRICRLIEKISPSALTLHHGNELKTSLHVPFENLVDLSLSNPSILPGCLVNNVEKDAFSKLYQSAYYFLAYQVILEQVYGISAQSSKTIVCNSADPETSVRSYNELILDHSFIKVSCKGSCPVLSKSLRRKLTISGCIEQFSGHLPALKEFKFYGLMLISTRDVTHREITRKCRQLMVKNDRFPDKTSIANLTSELESITGLQGIEVGLILKEEYCSPENHKNNLYPEHINPVLSGLLNNHDSRRLVDSFFSNRTAFFASDFETTSHRGFPILGEIRECGINSLLIFPVKINDKLIGVFGVMSATAGMIKREHANIIEPVVEILNIAMERSVERLDTRVDKVVKEKFTAVQNSVDWKFKEVALRYMQAGNIGDDKKIERVVFENVYPLYGSIDVRNSSIERMQAIQKDLLKQLKIAAGIVSKGFELCGLPLLGEMRFRLEKYVETVSIMLFPGDEVMIQQYLHENVSSILKHLALREISLSAEIQKYFEQIKADNSRLTTSCSKFDESIETINQELSRFLDEEQDKIQKTYPHYFERFVTDGIDFNIYIGQSITPSKPFEDFYLQNMKLWQLSTLVFAAKMTHRLARTLPVALQTTQLILAHSKPINISFRPAERKFDVDGAYNIHYEIIKKRIDKVRIRSTNERLTQPGTIAIVYSQAAEANEYQGYLEYLQTSGLVDGEIEWLELEELRGVMGLKALRVRIVLDTPNEIIAAALKGTSALIGENGKCEE